MWQLKCEIIYFSKERDEGLKGSKEVMAKIQNLKSQKFVIIIVFPPVFLKWSVKIKWKTKPLGIGFLIYMENCGMSNTWKQLLEHFRVLLFSWRVFFFFGKGRGSWVIIKFFLKLYIVLGANMEICVT